MWDMKCFVIRVITGATGIISTVLKIYVNNTRTFDIFSIKNRLARNITLHKESATI
jgi:hypothetical protein